jgi:hypothetical protein
MIAGVVTGHANGASMRAVLLGEDTLAYLLVLPLTVYNLRLSRREIERVLVVLFALAIAKSALGLAQVALGRGDVVEGTQVLTYYEPAPNWLVLTSMLGLLCAVLAQVRPPRWMLLGTPLLIACFVLSYRRSFWIAAGVGLTLVLILGLSPARRRLLIPAVLLVAGAIWALSLIGFQLADSPIVKRATSLNPTSLTSNLQDAYRLYERANVLGEIRQYPVTGLGMEIPWQATVKPLPIYNPNGQNYVHFAVLWYWLKLGILGAFAYVVEILAALWLGFLTWRRSRSPVARSFGLAAMCCFAGLIAIETTASFTGVDARLSTLIGVELGLLATLALGGGAATGP